MSLVGLNKQRLSQMHLCLYSRAFHPELFQIYAAEQHRGRTYELTAWIIGCSHVVTVRFGRSVLTELTAADPDLLGERRLIGRWRLRGERTCRQSVDRGRIGYLASFQVETLSDHLYRQTLREMVQEGRRRGLLAQFPQWKTDGLTPFSYLNCERCAKEVRVVAFHGFAEERALVKTQSIFEVG